MLDVYFYEAFEEEAAALRALLPESIRAAYTDLTIQESDHVAPPAKLISIRTQSKIPLAWRAQLDAILSRSTGYDHLVAYAAQLRPVLPSPALGYLPLYCHRAVAEQALLMWMALSRRLSQQLHQFQTFHRDGLTGHECLGRTLVVVGVGYIGYEICKLGQAIGMRVLGVDLYQKFPDVEYASIEQALPRADVLVCAMDLNATSRGYFDSAKWQAVKRGCLFVNISRGELSPSAQLLDALKAGQLGGVALDVYNHEAELAVSLRTGAPSAEPEVAATIELSQRDDCICTPHNAFNSAEAVLRKSEHSVQQIISFLQSGAFLWSPPGMGA